MDVAFDLALKELEQVVRSGQILSAEQKSCLIRDIRQGIIEKADDSRLMAGIRGANFYGVCTYRCHSAGIICC